MGGLVVDVGVGVIVKVMGVATISCGGHWVGHRCQRKDQESF